MTEQEIQKDRQDRISACREAIQNTLIEHGFDLEATYISADGSLRISVPLVLRDAKVYDAEVAQTAESPVTPLSDAPVVEQAEIIKE